MHRSVRDEVWIGRGDLSLQSVADFEHSVVERLEWSLQLLSFFLSIYIGLILDDQNEKNYRFG